MLPRTLAILLLLPVPLLSCKSATRSGAQCGFSPADWCASPPGDPCGRHHNTPECRADPRCKGMPYRGESVVPCEDDGTGFAKNCPSVGCISR